MNAACRHEFHLAALPGGIVASFCRRCGAPEDARVAAAFAELTGCAEHVPAVQTPERTHAVARATEQITRLARLLGDTAILAAAAHEGGWVPVSVPPPPCEDVQLAYIEPETDAPMVNEGCLRHDGRYVLTPEADPPEVVQPTHWQPLATHPALLVAPSPLVDEGEA